MGTEQMWQLVGDEMWVGDQLWHCSYLKTEHKDKLAQKKSLVLQSLLFFLKHKQPTQQQHTGKGAPPVSTWCDIMPQCQSDVQASVIGECEKNVRGGWLTVQTHIPKHTNTRTVWSSIRGHTQVMQGFLLTAPVPYRHHRLPLVSNPGIKIKEGNGGRGRVGQ